MRLTLILVFLICLFCQPRQLFSQKNDIQLLRKIVDNRNEKLDDAFYLLSQTSGLASIRFGVYGLGVFIFAKDSAKKVRGFNLAASLVAAGAVAYGTKFIYQRNRPYTDFPDLEHYYEPTSASFPSTSTSLAFGTATSLSLAYKKWYVTVPAFVWASAVGYSRLHLGVHYPSDVLAGAVFGASSSYISFRANKWFTERKRAKRKKIASLE